MKITVLGGDDYCGWATDIRDTVRCIELACEVPAAGECRVFNQFTEQFSVLELTYLVQAAARKVGLNVRIDHLPDPRT